MCAKPHLSQIGIPIHAFLGWETPPPAATPFKWRLSGEAQRDIAAIEACAAEARVLCRTIIVD